MAPKTVRLPQLDISNTPPLRPSARLSSGAGGSPSLSAYSRSPSNSLPGSPLRQEFDEDADAIIVNDGSLVDSQDWLSVPAPHLLSQEAYVTQNNLAVLAKKLDQVMKVVLWLQRNEASRVKGGIEKRVSKLGEIDSVTSDLVDDIIAKHQDPLMNILKGYAKGLSTSGKKKQERLTGNAGAKMNEQCKKFLKLVDAAGIESGVESLEANAAREITQLDNPAKNHLFSRLVKSCIPPTSDGKDGGTDNAAEREEDDDEGEQSTPVTNKVALDALNGDEYAGLLRDQFVIFKATLVNAGEKPLTRKTKNTRKQSGDFKQQIVITFQTADNADAGDDHAVLSFINALSGDDIDTLYLRLSKDDAAGTAIATAGLSSKKRTWGGEITGGESPVKKPRVGASASIRGTRSSAARKAGSGHTVISSGEDNEDDDGDDDDLA